MATSPDPPPHARADSSATSSAISRAYSRADAGRTPLPAVFAFTFLNSLCTSVVSNGISFVAKDGFKFSQAALFGLALVLGITYIAGARFAGPLLRMMEVRFPRLSRRGVLALLMVLMGALAALPQIALLVRDGQSVPPAWTIWVLIVLYSPLSGILWPLVEAFLSGGRSGKDLRSSVGKWNVVWSLAGASCYWLMAPLIEGSPALVLLSLTLVHFASMASLVWFPRQPGTHGEAGLDETDAHPDMALYSKLLATFRMLLPMAYVVNSALGPYLPGALQSLGLSATWATRAASSWLVARLVTFVVLERWHGWRGKWGTAIIGGAMILVGFAACVLTPPFAPGLVGKNASVVIMLVALAVFGAGMATVYTAALYYAMAVGKAEVDAGGTHEAIIGVGYAAGPSTGLVAIGLVSVGVVGESWFEPLMLAQVALVAVLVAVLVVRRVRSHTKSG